MAIDIMLLKRKKEGSKYNWNSPVFKALNIEVLQPYANKRETYELFESTIKALVQNYDKLSKEQSGNTHHKPFNPGELIANAINDDGTVDMKKMNIAYSKIAYASYQLADGITMVMLLRTDNLNYVIFKDADDLVQQWAEIKLFMVDLTGTMTQTSSSAILRSKNLKVFNSYKIYLLIQTLCGFCPIVIVFINVVPSAIHNRRQQIDKLYGRPRFRPQTDIFWVTGSIYSVFKTQKRLPALHYYPVSA